MYAKNIIKIHLLFISLEALNINHLKKHKYNNFIEFFKNLIQKKLFTILLLNSIPKKINSSKINNFQNILIFIYLIYIIIHDYSINNLIEIIFFNKIKNNNYELLNKYIYKFTYIYNKTYNYYYSNALNKKFKIEKIAITNLYIIKKVITEKNISYLLNYLLS